MGLIVDSYGRTFKTLRVSLTSSCNLGCVYCVDDSTTYPALPQDNLSLTSFLTLISNLNTLLKFDVVRLTGGEPTLYKNLIPLIEGLKGMGIPSIKMTTNGYLLGGKAKKLLLAGLQSINVSLDAIDPKVFYKISKRTNINRIVESIEEANTVGIEVKINSVIMRGFNEDQIIPLFEFASSKGLPIRFLELMKMGHLQVSSFDEHFFSEEEILEVLSQKYTLTKMPRSSSSTANYWSTSEGKLIGIIANESSPFCHDCNRLRVDSMGNVYGCLSENKAISLANCYNDKLLLESKLREALDHKQKIRFKGSDISMLRVGG